MNEFSQAMDKLRTSAQRLNEATDKANALVASVDEFLTNSGVGVYASVSFEYDTDDSCGVSEWTALVYDRIGGKYRVGIEWGCDAVDPDEFTVKPWAECAREDKLRAIQHLPALLTNIAANIDAAVASAETSVNQVSTIVSPTLPKKGGK